MSITDELREWAKGDALRAGMLLRTARDQALAIADRIDAEMMELPKDADGVPIHIGDVMDSKVDYLFDGKPFTVRGLVLCEDGWEVTDGRFGNRYKPDSLRHHHAPTVEDVLREFAYGLGVPVANSYIAATAAKLRLAGEGE